MLAAPASLACKKLHTWRTQEITGQPGHPAFPAQWAYGLSRALPGVRAW